MKRSKFKVWYRKESKRDLVWQRLPDMYETYESAARAALAKEVEGYVTDIEKDKHK